MTLFLHLFPYSECLDPKRHVRTLKTERKTVSRQSDKSYLCLQFNILVQTDGRRQRTQGETYHTDDLNTVLTRQQLMLKRNPSRFKTDGVYK